MCASAEILLSWSHKGTIVSKSLSMKTLSGLWRRGVCLSFTFIISTYICPFTCFTILFLYYFLLLILFYYPASRRKSQILALIDLFHMNSFLKNTPKMGPVNFLSLIKLDCRTYTLTCTKGN